MILRPGVFLPRIPLLRNMSSAPDVRLDNASADPPLPSRRKISAKKRKARQRQNLVASESRRATGRQRKAEQLKREASRNRRERERQREFQEIQEASIASTSRDLEERETFLRKDRGRIFTSKKNVRKLEGDFREKLQALDRDQSILERGKQSLDRRLRRLAALAVCKACGLRLDQACVLTCGHCFCSYCLVSANAGGRVFTCNLCQSVTTCLPRPCQLIDGFVSKLSNFFSASVPLTPAELLQERRATVTRYRTAQVRDSFKIPRRRDGIAAARTSVGSAPD